MQLVNTKTKLKENNENCDKKWKLNGKLISHVVLLCELHKNQAKVERLSTTKTRGGGGIVPRPFENMVICTNVEIC